MSGAAFTPEEFAIAVFLYLVFPLSIPTLVGGIAGRRLEGCGHGHRAPYRGYGGGCGLLVHQRVVKFRPNNSPRALGPAG